MEITAIKLVREHRGGFQHAVVYAEIGGKLIEMIREDANGAYRSTVDRKFINDRAAFELSTNDFVASGGIIDATWPH